jgi:hypothetical protein
MRNATPFPAGFLQGELEAKETLKTGSKCELTCPRPCQSVGSAEVTSPPKSASQQSSVSHGPGKGYFMDSGLRCQCVTEAF